MNYTIYIPNDEQRAELTKAWPAVPVASELSLVNTKHTVILKDSITISGSKFFDEIQRLCDANNYLDALRHPAFLLFGNNYVKLHDGRDYWTYNFRPVVDFDNSTWHD